ncbi:MAG TPA: nuclear transport factor 2 family protein [Propionibacteriaceae bacterium]
MTDLTPAQLATIYLESWQAEDFDRLEQILSPEVTFSGPLAAVDGRENCLAGLKGMASMMTGITIDKMLSDDSDVMTWYDLHVEGAVLPTVNWSHVENGLITAIRATFDPRPVAPPS